MIRFQTGIILTAALLACPFAAASAPPALGPLETATTLIQVPVVLRPEDRSRVDTIGAANGPEFRSGEVFAAVFTGTPSTPLPVVEITSTRADSESTQLGLSRRYTYHINATLRIRGETHVLMANGSAKQLGARNAEFHAQLACERATVDLAKQIQTLLARERRPDSSRPGDFHSRHRAGHPAG